MRLARASGMLGLVAVALIASPCAMAQDPGFYLGFNVGQSKARIDNERITSSLLGAGFTTTSINDSDRSTGFKLFAGYRFNEYFSLEGGYFQLGKFGFDADTAPAGTLSGELKAKGMNFDAVFSVPFTEKFSAFARIGANYANVEDTFTATGAVNVLTPDPKEKATNIKFGAGVEYDFTRHVGMRAEAERYRINDPVQRKGDIDLVSLGLIFRFGGHHEEAASEAEAQPPPPPAPAAAEPVIDVVPVPAETQQYCTILDIQFEVDQDDIQREEKEKLGVIGTFLNKYPDTTAVIEGHTDNVGTPEHNMELSKSRAQSVVSYLVDKQHIAPSRLTAVGYGDSRPIADNSTDEGKRMNRRIDAVVACVTDVAGLAVAPARMTMALAMEYDLDKADVKPKYHDDLLRVADFLKAHPGVTATVEGHTGNATPANSMEVSQLRAQNVVNYLVDNFGIPRSRLSAEGFGQNRRIAYNTSAEGRQENRRVNIIFNYPK